MKYVVVLSLAAALLSTGAQASVDTDLSRSIESQISSADGKARAADVAFDGDDAAGGCRALIGAARDLDAGIDMSLRLVEGTEGLQSIGENRRDHHLIQTMHKRLEMMVDKRTHIQRELEERCVSA